MIIIIYIGFYDLINNWYLFKKHINLYVKSIDIFRKILTLFTKIAKFSKYNNIVYI